MNARRLLISWIIPVIVIVVIAWPSSILMLGAILIALGSATLLLAIVVGLIEDRVPNSVDSWKRIILILAIVYAIVVVLKLLNWI